MKKYYALLLGALLLLCAQLSAQELQMVRDVQIVNDLPSAARLAGPLETHKITASTCGPDTLSYGLNKSTSLGILNVNGATSAGALGQYYDAPQPITISKLRFYAYKLSTAGGISGNMIVELYYARADSLPLGNPIATTTVVVDTNYYGGTLSGLQKVATFPNPVTLSAPYIVAVRNNGPNPIGVVINSYTSADGAGEWLGMAQINTWRHGYQVNVSGLPFNCDVLLDPVVNYNLAANFNANPTCIASAGTATFTNTSSPIIRNRMYNLAEFLHIGGNSVNWNFGDGSPAINQVTNFDTTHFYAAPGNYAVRLGLTMFGWANSCLADTTITLGQGPVAQFSQTANNLVVNFTDLSTNAPATWNWDFGDGQTATIPSPQHAYAIGGTYQVCLTVTTPCGTDSSCRNITVACPVPNTAFASAPTNLSVNFTDQTTGSGVNTWMWTFGDGGTALTQSPAHTYATAGTYTVCLQTSNACGNDSSCHTITVACAAPVATFTPGNAGLTMSFTNQSTGTGNTYAWDFGDGGTSTVLTPTHTYAANSTYYVCLTVTNVCGTDQFCDSISTVPVAVSGRLATDALTLFPNPNAGAVKAAIALPTLQPVQLRIYNALGMTMADLSLGEMQSGVIELPISGLVNGQYWVELRTGNAFVMQRMQVMR